MEDIIKLVDEATEKGVLYDLVESMDKELTRFRNLREERRLLGIQRDVERSHSRVIDAGAFIDEACELLDEHDVNTRKYRYALDTLWDMEGEMEGLLEKVQKDVEDFWKSVEEDTQ